jgi:hypothetical protein
MRRSVRGPKRTIGENKGKRRRNKERRRKR